MKKTPEQKKIEETQEVERINEKEKEMKEFVESFSSKQGFQKTKEISKWVSNGMFMGASDAIPGYSGGTTMALIGFFKKLILISKCLFVPAYGISRLRALLFMFPFIIGWIVGVFCIAKATEATATAGMGLELLFFFSSFVIAAIPIYLRSIKHKRNSPIKPLEKKFKIILIILGFIIVITLALIVLLVKNGAPFHGVDKSKHETEFDITLWWKLAIVAFCAGMVTLMPGGSGAIIQLLSGMYDKIHWTIMAHANENLGVLVIFAFFTFMGMVTMVFIMSWFLIKRERMIEIFSLGMLIASPIAILIIPEKELWINIKNWKHILGILAAITLGTGLGAITNIYTKRKQVRL